MSRRKKIVTVPREMSAKPLSKLIDEFGFLGKQVAELQTKKEQLRLAIIEKLKVNPQGGPLPVWRGVGKSFEASYSQFILNKFSKDLFIQKKGHVEYEKYVQSQPPSKLTVSIREHVKDALSKF